MADLQRVTTPESDALATLAGWAAEQSGLVTVSQCLRAGVTRRAIDRHVRSRRWRRVDRGTLLFESPPDGRPSDDVRLHSALLAAGPEAVAVGLTAARLHGVEGLPSGEFVPELALPPNRTRTQRPGMRLRWTLLRPDEVTLVGDVPCTTPVRTVADAVLQLSRPYAVSVLDSALQKGVIAASHLVAVEAAVARRRGAARVRQWLGLCDGRAESPLETRARLCFVDGSVAPDELQYPVYAESGVVLGRADFAWTRHRLLGEADGAGPHDQLGALYRDRQRQNDLAASGLRVLRFTWADVSRPAYAASVVRRALRQPG